MGNIVDETSGVTTIGRDDSPHLGFIPIPFHRFTEVTGELTTLDAYQRRYGASSMSLVTVMHDELSGSDTPPLEADLSLLHTMVVAPVVIAFASECLSTYEKSVDELQQLSDYLFSHFLYDRSGDHIGSMDDIHFIRGSAIEYYVGNSTDSSHEHLLWLGSQMTGVNEFASVLADRASVERELIESLLASESRPLAGGTL